MSKVPLEKWVFGQFSKLLPAKASCRALANLETESTTGFNLDKVGARIAADAAVLGDYLMAIDRREGYGRDDALALGFPSNGENADRSRLRYATQFVGTFSQGRLSGTLFEFRLASLTQLVPRQNIRLTVAGWRFAALPNPALDGDRGERFSDEEIAFLLAHIRDNVRAEHFAYQTLLKAVRSGANTPQKLDRVCKGLVSGDREGDLSEAFITTQRTGVISRLNELRLIARHRDGNRVTYILTDQGNAYLKRAAA